MFDPEYFKMNLKTLRNQRGVSQQIVADGVGVGRTLVNRWETGDRLPSISALWRLADYFDVSVDELIGRKR